MDITILIGLALIACYGVKCLIGKVRESLETRRWEAEDARVWAEYMAYERELETRDLG